MQKSLSLIVPVHNAENSLSRQVARLLDLLPDLTQRFELVIVDDASTDNTADVATEISREYPQVRVVVQSRQLGLTAAAAKGTQHASGEVVLLLDEIANLGSAELRQLWNERRHSAVCQARATPVSGPFEEPLLTRLSAWGQAMQSTNRAPGPAAEPRFSIPDIGRADASHEPPKKVKPVRSFLKHLRELTLGE